MSFNTDILEHATELDIKIGGVSLMNFDADGVRRGAGTDYNWFTHLSGSNFCIGGGGSGGALTEAVTVIGSFRAYNVWALPNSVSNQPFIEFNFWLPPDYDGSALKITCYMVRTSTSTGTDIVTNIRLGCIGAGDTLNLTTSSQNNVTDTTGANNTLFLVEHTVTPANAADGGMCHGFIQRVPTDAADDYTGSVYLIGARVEYA